MTERPLDGPAVDVTCLEEPLKSKLCKELYRLGQDLLKPH